jgi:hypothetical protein
MENKVNQEEVDRIADMCRLILSQWGGVWEVYCDFLYKIRISRTVFCMGERECIEVDISPFMGFFKKEVFKWYNDDIVTVFREGTWIKYLEEIAEKAKLDKEKDKVLEMKERENNFSPIDDSKIFSKYKDK